MKVIKALGRTFWTIISIVLLLVAVLCVFLLSPQVVSRAEVTIIVTALAVTTITFPPLSGIFGGNVEMTSKVESFLNGEAISDPVTATAQYQLNFDYIALIGIILGVVGVVLAIIFYRKKALLGVSSLFTLASTIILACQGLTFLFVNPDLGEVVNQGSIEGLLETSCISIGGIIFAVCMGILFLMSLVRFFLTKSSSNK